MINLASDRQWLWSNKRIPFSRSQYNVNFGKTLDSGGWDEILLSILPAQFKVGADTILNIPDHGDLVGQAWSVTKAEVDSNGDAVCELTANGRAANYRITRTVRLRNGRSRIEVNYAWLNREAVELPWLGLWINNRGWSGDGGEPYQNLEIEPATTPFDGIVEAAENDAITWLQPDETKLWSIEVELRS